MIKQSSLITVAIIFSLFITGRVFAENATSTKTPLKIEIKKITSDKIASSSPSKHASNTVTTSKNKSKISTTTIPIKKIKEEVSTTTRTDSIKARKAEILKEIFLRRHKNDKQSSTSTAANLSATTTATSTLKKK